MSIGNSTRVPLLGLLLSAGLVGSPSGAVPARIRPSINALGASIAADLDGDGRLDLAAAGASHHQGTGYVQDITVRLSPADTRTVAVYTAGLPLRLRVFDLDGDSDRDLVLEAFDHKPLAVLLNDGDGNFHQVSIEEFGYQLQHSESHSLEGPAAACQSIEISEDAPHPVAEHAAAGFQLQLTCTCLAAMRHRLWLAISHWNLSSRGPPLLF